MQSNDRKWAALGRALVFLLIASILSGPASCTTGGSKKGTSPKSKTGLGSQNAPVNFVLVDSRAVADDKVAQNRAPEIEAAKQTESDKIVHLVQDYYESAFLNPELWDNGGFSRVESFFAPAIRDRVKNKDLQNLSLSKASSDLDYLKETDAKITELLINLDENIKPRLSVATIKVTAKFVQKDGKPADFESSAVFFLEPGGDSGWQIFDYNLKYRLESEGKTP